MNNSNSSFLKNSMMNLTGNLLTVIISLGTSILIARGLGVEGQGLYAIITLLPTLLVTFLNLGVGPATVFYIGREKYTMSQIISTNIFLSIAISVIALIIAYCSIFPLKNTYYKEIELFDLYLILLSIPFLFFNSFIQAVYQGLQNFRKFNIINVFNKVIQLIYLVVLLVIGRFYLTEVLMSFIISSLVPSLILIFGLYKESNKFLFSAISINLMKEMFSYGFKAHLSNIVSFLNYRADIIMLTILSSTYSVGIYNIAVLIAERLWIFSQPISTALFPRISTMRDVEEKNKLTSFTARTVLYFSIVFAIIFAVICDFFVVIVFGSDYKDATQPILILLVGITIFSSERILSNDLAGRGKPEYNLYTTLITIVCNVVLNFIFIPKYGFNGAALSTSIAYCLTFIVKILIFTKFTGVKVREIILLTSSDLKIYRIYIEKAVNKIK